MRCFEASQCPQGQHVIVDDALANLWFQGRRQALLSNGRKKTKQYGMHQVNTPTHPALVTCQTTLPSSKLQTAMLSIPVHDGTNLACSPATRTLCRMVHCH